MSNTYAALDALFGVTQTTVLSLLADEYPDALIIEDGRALMAATDGGILTVEHAS